MLNKCCFLLSLPLVLFSLTQGHRQLHSQLLRRWPVLLPSGSLCACVFSLDSSGLTHLIPLLGFPCLHPCPTPLNVCHGTGPYGAYSQAEGSVLAATWVPRGGLVTHFHLIMSCLSPTPGLESSGLEICAMSKSESWRECEGKWGAVEKYSIGKKW